MRLGSGPRQSGKRKNVSSDFKDLFGDDWHPHDPDSESQAQAQRPSKQPSDESAAADFT